MPSKVTLKPFRSKYHPALKWVVYWPAAEQGQQRKTRRFKTKTEAERFRLDKETQVTNQGRKAAALRDEVFADAVWASEQLSGHGVSIREVVRDYLDRSEKILTSVKIDDAIPDFIATKKGSGKSVRYVQDLRARCTAFAKEFGDRTLAEISVTHVERWLEGLEVSPVTRNNFRRALSAFFSWGRKRGYCSDNPVQHVEKAKEVRERVEIFTPSELRVILEAAPADLVPQVAIGAFAGLRTSEIERLRWEDLDFLLKRIDVRAKIAKTAATRYVPMRDSLLAWIQSGAKASGWVVPRSMNKKMTNFRQRLREEDQENGRPAIQWKHNGLRHSFASYALAECENAGQVAMWLGHDSNKMIFKHYRERVTPESAAEWFSITPTKSEKVSPLFRAL